MATAGSIVIDLLARTGSFETDMNRARKKVGELDSDLKGMVTRLDRAALAVGAVAVGAVAGLAALTMQTVKTMDATSKMATQIGVTTEALTGMRFAIQQFANVSDQQVDLSMRRMTRRIEEAAQGSGAAKSALDAMGLSARELARLSPDQQILAIADAMQKTESQAQRLRQTMAIFDSEGMALVPALQEGAAALRENIELATRYGVVLSTRAAKSAEQLSTNLSRLSSIQDGLRQQMTTAFLPAIERASGYLLGVAESALEVGNSKDRLQEFGKAAVGVVDDLARSYVGLVEIGRGVKDLFDLLDEAASRWVEPFKLQTQSATNLLSQSFSESVLNTAREIDKLVGFAGGVMSAWDVAAHNIEEYFRSAWNSVLIETEDFINKLIEKINPVFEKLGRDGFEPIKLADHDFIALYYDIKEAFDAGYESAVRLVNMTGRVQAAFDGVAASSAGATGGDGNGGAGGGGVKGLSKEMQSLIDKLLPAEKALKDYHKSLGMISSAYQAGGLSTARYTKALETLNLAYAKQVTDLLPESVKKAREAVKAAQDQEKALRQQIRTFGMAESAVLALAAADTDAALAKLEATRASEIADGATQERIRNIDEEIAALRQLRDLQLGMSGLHQQLEWKGREKAAWDSWASDMDQVFQQVGQSLTDRLFDGGKSGLDLLKDWAKTLTLRVLVQPVMTGLQGLFTGAGPAGVGTAAGAGSGLMSNAGSLFSMFGGNSMGMGISNVLSGLSTSSMLSGTAAGNWMMGTAGNVAGMSNLALGGAGLLGGLGANLIFGGQGHSGTLGGLGATAGMALGGPIGAVAGSLIGGGLGSLFGDREPTTRREQRTQIEYAGGLYDITRRDDRAPAGADAAARQMAEQAVQTANDIFRQVGVDAAIDSFHAILASSYAGDRDGVASGGRLRIGDEYRQFGIASEGNPTIQGYGGWSSEDMVSRLAVDLQISMMEAVQQVGASTQLPRVLAEMVEGVYLRGLGEAEIGELATRFAAAVQGASDLQLAVQALPFAHLRDLSFEAALGLNALFGGVENFVGAHATYLENFYSEAERQEIAVGNLTKAFAGAGLELPPLIGTADEMRATYRALAEAQDKETESGREMYAMIIQAAGAFSEVANFAGAANDALLGTADALDLLGQAASAFSRSATAAQRAMQMMTSGGALADRIGGMLGLDPVFAMRREQELWSTIGAASYEQQIEMSGELTDMVLNRINKEQQANQQRLVTIREELTNYRRMRDIGASLQTYLGSLESSNLAPYSLAEKVSNAESELASLVSAAKGGDETAARQVQGALQNALTLWRDYGASGAEYQEAYHRLTGMVGNLANAAVSDATRQIAQLEAQSAALEGMSGISAESLAQLQQLYDITTAATEAAYSQYQSELANANTELAQLERMGLDTARLHDIVDLLQGLPASLAAQIQAGGSAGLQYMIANPDVMSAYDQYGQGTAGDYALQHYTDHGQSEGRQYNASRGEQYLINNPDVLAAYSRGDFGDMSVDAAAKYHFDNYGKFDGRSYAVGTDFVPHDMLANIHRGEIIIDPRSSDILRNHGIKVQGQGGGRQTDELLRSIVQRLDSMQAQGKQLSQQEVEAMIATAKASANTIVGGVGGSIERRNRDDGNARAYKRSGTGVFA